MNLHAIESKRKMENWRQRRSREHGMILRPQRTKPFGGLRRIIRFGQWMKGGEAFFSICMQSAGHQKIIYFFLSPQDNACEVCVRFCLYCKPFSQLLKREIIGTEVWNFGTIWFEIQKQTNYQSVAHLSWPWKDLLIQKNSMRALYTCLEKKTKYLY